MTVTMEEYRFGYDPAIPAGRVVFRVRNVGALYHRLTLVPLPEDVPPIDIQLHGTERRSIEPFAGVFERGPGGTGTFAVELRPGTRYAFLCLLQGPDGESHALKGMSSEFRPTA